MSVSLYLPLFPHAFTDYKPQYWECPFLVVNYKSLSVLKYCMNFVIKRTIQMVLFVSRLQHNYVQAVCCSKDKVIILLGNRWDLATGRASSHRNSDSTNSIWPCMHEKWDAVMMTVMMVEMEMVVMTMIMKNVWLVFEYFCTIFLTIMSVYLLLGHLPNAVGKTNNFHDKSVPPAPIITSVILANRHGSIYCLKIFSLVFESVCVYIMCVGDFFFI